MSDLPACPLDLLVVAPHPDDAELSVAGILLRCRDEGWKVGVIDLTSGEPTPFGTPEIRAQETQRATDLLGLDWRYNLGLPNRSLQPTLEARRALAEVYRATRPRLILAPYWDDIHPDHVAASQLADDARFWSKLTRSDLRGSPFWPPRMLYYWSIHLRIHPAPKCVIDITPYLETKLEAIRCYASQFTTNREPRYPSPLDDIRDRARYWGWSINTTYAEPLGSREELGLASLRDVL